MQHYACVLAAHLRLRHAEELVARSQERLRQAEEFPAPARTPVTDTQTQVRDRARERLRDLEMPEDPVLDAVPELDRDRIGDRIRERLCELDGVNQSSTSTSIGTSTTATPLAGELDPDSVLRGVLMLIAGVGKASVASGLVGPEEMDAAAAALEGGQVDWRIATAQGGGRVPGPTRTR